jgi:hypothetical protein
LIVPIYIPSPVGLVLEPEPGRAQVPEPVLELEQVLVPALGLELVPGRVLELEQALVPGQHSQQPLTHPPMPPP